MRDSSHRFIIAILLLLGLFFLLTPFVIRTLQGNEALIGQASYFHLGTAQNILYKGSYPLAEATPTLFTALVAGGVQVAGPLLAGKLLPLVLGLCSLLCFFAAARKVLPDPLERSFAALLFIISPLFLMTFTALEPYGFALLLSMGAWLWYDGRRPLSLFSLGLLVFVDAKAFVIASLLLIAYGVVKDDWRAASIAGASGVFAIIALDAFFGFLARDALAAAVSSGDFFVTLGAEYGYSFFILFLALVGIVASWSRERRYVVASVILAGVFFFSFSDALTRVLLLPVLAILSGRGVAVLARREWAVREIKAATLFLVGLSLLFTFVMALTSQVQGEPSLERLEAMHFLRTVPEDEVVLSSPENGIFIERLSRRQAFLDDVSLDDERLGVAERIFYSQRVEVTASLLEEQGISHVLIDSAMRDGDVWTYEEQGLLFLARYSPRFVLVYDKGDVQVYRFIND